VARRVFFSFHYQNDIWRVCQIRNSWVTQERQAAGFWDAALWEKIKRAGEEAVKKWINAQLSNTSVTVVLIGRQTAERKYVNYEIQRSHERGNGMLGIWLHNMKDVLGLRCTQGKNPYDNFYIEQGTKITYLSQIYPVYDWVLDKGYRNFGTWVETAARTAGR